MDERNNQDNKKSNSSHVTPIHYLASLWEV